MPLEGGTRLALLAPLSVGGLPRATRPHLALQVELQAPGNFPGNLVGIGVGKRERVLSDDTTDSD